MTLSMKADIKERWVEELRSGKYIQGGGDLHWIGPVGNREKAQERFCCLGILSKMCAEAGAVVAEKDDHMYTVAYGESMDTAYLPKEVVEWAGLVYDGERQYTDAPIEEARGILHTGLHVPSQDVRSLAMMNDSGVPFEEIAQVIEDEVIGV